MSTRLFNVADVRACDRVSIGGCGPLLSERRVGFHPFASRRCMRRVAEFDDRSPDAVPTANDRQEELAAARLTIAVVVVSKNPIDASTDRVPVWERMDFGIWRPQAAEDARLW